MRDDRCRQGARSSRLTVLAAAALVCLLASSRDLAAMPASAAPVADTLIPASAAPVADTLRNTRERRLYVAMWTYHFRKPRGPLENNQLLAVSWGKFYAATFINSFDERSYTAGIQAILARKSLRAFSLGFGYRVGLLVGYDERLFPLAGEIPVLPLLQPLLMFDLPRLGFELSYSGIVISGGINVRL